MSDPLVKRHFAVAAFTPGTENNGLGNIGAAQTILYATVDEAKVAAREMAADNPGAVFVVYAALWYAFTDATPVNLLRVGEVT